MNLRWTDSLDIAIELLDKYPEQDPYRLNFVDLRQMVLELENFDDDADRCGEKILEAIQAAWIEEMD